MTRGRAGPARILKRLAVTPAPRAGESLASYVSRLAWANGMLPRHLTQRLSSQREGAFRLVFPLSALIKVVGPETTEVEHFAQDLSRWGGDRTSWLGNMGPRLMRPAAVCRLCPLCLLEEGFVQRQFDFLSLTACPAHGCRLIDQCPACATALSWDRRAATHCGCGCDLTAPEVTRYDVSAQEAALNDLLCGSDSSSKFAGRAEALGLPVDMLRTLSAQELLSCLAEVGKLATVGRQVDLLDGPGLTFAAVSVMERWPETFASHIHSLFEGDARQDAFNALFVDSASFANPSVKRRDLLKRWRPFVADELFNALVTGPGFHLNPVTKRRVFGDRAWPWMPTSAAAKTFGLSTRQLLFAESVGEVTLLRPGPISRTVVDTVNIPEPVLPRIARRSLASVDAQLNLPRGMLLCLIRAEAFGQPAIYTGHGITDRALGILLDVLAQCAANQPAQSREPPEGMVLETVGSILRRSTFDRDAKVRLVRQLVSGEMTAWRRRKDFFELEIAGSPSTVLERSKRRFIPGSSSVIDFGKAARHLETSRNAVAQLVWAQRMHDGGMRGRFNTVTLTSLHRFSRQYISTGRLCGLLSQFPATIVRLRMARLAPEVHYIDAGTSGARFYRRSDIGDSVEFVTRLLS